MVKHTQTICRLLSTNCLSVFDHFVEFALKGLKNRILKWSTVAIIKLLQWKLLTNYFWWIPKYAEVPWTIVFRLRKKSCLRANNSPFITETKAKEIMDRAIFRNKFFKNITLENKLAYNKQRNFFLSLVRNAKMDYCNNRNPKTVIDNKFFWNMIKPFFSGKGVRSQKITLM